MTAEMLLRRYVELYNARASAELSQLYGEDAERTTPHATVRGREAIRLDIERFWAEVPESTLSITHAAAGAGVILYEFRDDPRGLPGAGVMVIGGAQIREHRVYYDPALGS